MRTKLGLLLLTLLLPAPAQAGLYWVNGTRSSSVSVCFVGDAVTSRPNRVAEILSDIKEFSYAANIDFVYLGQCTAPTTQANGDDYYSGDIRVVLPSTSVDATGMVPGEGCPMFQDDNGNYNGENDGWGSWSNAPNDLSPNRACLYNLKLGDDPWNGDPYLNHTLHEFGHALGLAHEHKRLDASADCTESSYGGTATSYLTWYDTDSVMHYAYASCDIDGNYGIDGLSPEDMLSLHILYPETDYGAEFVGTTVIRTTDTLKLQSAWKYRGAYMNYVANSFSWKLNGTTYSTGDALTVNIGTAGTYSLSLSHRDLLNRSYSTSYTVRVLAPADFIAQVAGPVAAL